MSLSSYHGKVSLQVTLVSLDFSHQALVIAHVIIIIFFNRGQQFLRDTIIPLADHGIATSDILKVALVGNEIMASLTCNSGSGAFSHPQT